MLPNTARQPSHTWIQPPITGASAGPRLNMMVIALMTRCAWAPLKQSRTTARPMIMPTPPTIPCRARKNSSAPNPGASAQPMEASAYSTSPTSTTRRRPTASESEPCTSDMQA